MLDPKKRTGTGFTNINKIYEANKNNRLGQVVSSGIQGESDKVQQNLGKAQTGFMTEAEKNRLDSEQNRQKTQDMIGRFDQSKYTPDESKFTVSSGLQEQYDRQKKSFQESQVKAAQQAASPYSSGRTGANVQPVQQTGTAQQGVDRQTGEVTQAPASGSEDSYLKQIQEAQAAQRTGAQSEYDKIQQALNASKTIQSRQNELSTMRDALLSRAPQSSPGILGGSERRLSDQDKLNYMKQADPAAYKAYMDSKAALDQDSASIKSIIGDTKAGYITDALKARLQLAQTNLGLANSTNTDAYTSGLSNIDKLFQQQRQSELDKWKQTQIDEQMAAAAPSEAEINEFARLRSGVYGGPKEIQDYATLAGEAQRAEDIGSLARMGSGGRAELLKQFVGGTEYTPGLQKLDTLLMGESAGSDLRKASRESMQSLDRVQAANEQARQFAQELTGRAKTFGEETTGQLQGVRDQFSGALDQKLAETQKSEQQRSSELKNVQDILSGSNPQFKNLDAIARAGLGLQAAVDQGAISAEQANALLGDKGLYARARAAGLDPNALISERIKDIQAQNMTRAGVATSAEETRMNAIDRLLGRQGTDVEFGAAQDDMTAGTGQFDIDSFRKLIEQTEAAKGIDSSQFNLPTQQANNLQQSLGYLGSGLQGDAQGTIEAAGAYLTPWDVGNAAQAGETLANATIDRGASVLKGQNAVAEGLLKLNVGGKSLANTEGGKQLMKLLEAKGNLENQAIATGKEWSGGLSESISDIASGKMSTSDLLNASTLGSSGILKNIASNVGGAVSTALFGGETGKWSTDKLNMKDAAGNKVKVGAYANAGSGDILAQMNQYAKSMENRKRISNDDRNERARILTRMNQYYQEALKREAKAKAALPKVQV